MATTKKTTKEEKKETADKTSMKDLYSEKTAVKKVAGDAKTETKSKRFGSAYRILVKPLVTEKASILGAANKYIFEVAKDVNKIEVAKAIMEVYGVKPLSVNIIKVIGKKARYGKIFGKRKDRKKAIVTLAKGIEIKVYEGV